MIINEWWQLLEDNWDNIKGLVTKFHPGLRMLSPEDYPITAHVAEAVCDAIREGIAAEYSLISPALLLLSAKENKDHAEIFKILNETWFGMPESTSVRDEPGFFVLCDLCSEYES